MYNILKQVIMNKTLLWAIVLLILSNTIGYTSIGYTMCSEPSVPGCISIKETYKEEEIFFKCKKSFQDYVLEMKKFSICQNDEFSAKAQETQDRVNKAVETFNCMVEKEGEC
jgi:hypothetical protein